MYGAFWLWNYFFFFFPLLAEAIPLEEPTLWETQNKTFETWICPLVHSLIGYNNDAILRYSIHTFKHLFKEFVYLNFHIGSLVRHHFVMEFN